MVPLLVVTVWVALVYGRTYKPLMTFIALRSVERGDRYSDNTASEPDSASNSSELAREPNVWDDTDGGQPRYHRETSTSNGKAVDESRETGVRFINPSLVAPLNDVWIGDKAGAGTADRDQVVGEESV